MALALAAPATLPMRIVGVIAVLLSVLPGPRTSLAQVRSVANEAVVDTKNTASSVSALAAWEDALASGIADPDVWSAIGQRLHAAGRYRECIAALERSLVLRMRRTRDDDDLIADAYSRLGNVKQARRWSSAAGMVSTPSIRGNGVHESTGRHIRAGDGTAASWTRGFPRSGGL